MCGFSDLIWDNGKVVCPVCGVVKTREWLGEVVLTIGKEEARRLNPPLLRRLLATGTPPAPVRPSRV